MILSERSVPSSVVLFVSEVWKNGYLINADDWVSNHLQSFRAPFEADNNIVVL